MIIVLIALVELATQRWPNLWKIAASANPQAQLRDVYEVLELELGFYTLTARIPTPSKTGLMYRLFNTAKAENPRVTLQTMLESIQREINEGKRNGLQAGAGIAYTCPGCGVYLY